MVARRRGLPSSLQVSALGTSFYVDTTTHSIRSTTRTPTRIIDFGKGASTHATCAGPIVAVLARRYHSFEKMTRFFHSSARLAKGVGTYIRQCMYASTTLHLAQHETAPIQLPRAAW